MAEGCTEGKRAAGWSSLQQCMWSLSGGISDKAPNPRSPVAPCHRLSGERAASGSSPRLARGSEVKP